MDAQASFVQVVWELESLRPTVRALHCCVNLVDGMRPVARVELTLQQLYTAIVWLAVLLQVLGICYAGESGGRDALPRFTLAWTLLALCAAGMNLVMLASTGASVDSWALHIGVLAWCVLGIPLRRAPAAVRWGCLVAPIVSEVLRAGMQFDYGVRVPLVLSLDVIVVSAQTGAAASMLSWRLLTLSHASGLLKAAASGSTHAEVLDARIRTPPFVNHESCVRHLVLHWDTSGRRVIEMLLRRWRGRYAALAALKALLDIGGLVTPVLLRMLTENLSHGTAHRASNVTIVMLLVIVSLGAGVLRTQYSLQLQHIAIHARGVLSAAVCRHAACLKRHEAPSGANVATHLTVDVNRIVDQIPCFNDLWSLPLQVLFALYLLYLQVSFAFVSGLVITLALIPVNMKLAKRIGCVNTELLRHNDERVLRVSEVLNNIRFVKMCGWAAAMLDWISRPRAAYMLQLRWLKLLDAWCVFFWATTPVFVSLATFSMYVWMGNELTPGRAVAALALFNMLILPLNAYPWVINGAVEANVSRRRLEEFLATLDLTADRDAQLQREGETFRGSRAGGSDAELAERLFRGIGVVDLHISPSRSAPTKIAVDSFELRRGELVVVTGAPGCGKSTLLRSLIGEAVVTGRDAASIDAGSAALVSQEPFLVGGSIRDNVLFGRPFEQTRYDRALHAAALSADVAAMPAGDGTAVGERGCALSGGQRLRVTLARAFFAEKPVVLLDDPLSCLDTTVCAHVVRHFIRPLLAEGTAIVIATHRIEFVSVLTDRVYTIEDGRTEVRAGGKNGTAAVSEQASRTSTMRWRRSSNRRHSTAAETFLWMQCSATSAVSARVCALSSCSSCLACKRCETRVTGSLRAG